MDKFLKIDESYKPIDNEDFANKLKAELNEGKHKEFGEKKIKFMVACLGDERGNLRRFFAESLGKIGRKATPHLITALRTSKNVTQRRAAAKTLKLVGDPSALPYLVAALMEDEDPVVQGSAAGAIAIFGAKSIKYLLDILENPKANSMQLGFASWAFTFASSEAPETIKKATKSSSTLIRSASIASLENLVDKLNSKEIEKILINALDDFSAEVRAEAVRVIVLIKDKDRAEKLLIEKINDQSSMVRKNCVLALIQINSKKSIKFIQDRLLIEDNESVKNILLLFLKQIKYSL